MVDSLINYMKFKKNQLIYLILLILITCYANFFTNSFTFEPIYSLYPDTTELYSSQLFYDPTLFRCDPNLIEIKRNFNAIRNFVYIGVYYFFMHLFPFPLAVKIISIILCILSTILIYRIGCLLYSETYAPILSVLFLVYFLSMDSFYGGHDRCFGALVFCIFLFFLMEGKFIFLPFVLALTIFSYPSYFFILAMICLLVPFFYRGRIKLNFYLPLLIISISIVLFFALEDKNFNFIIRNAELLRSYKYNYIQGKNIIIRPDNPLHILFYFILNFNEHSRLYIYFTTLFISVCFIFIILKKTKVLYLPRAIWITIFASTLCFLFIYPFSPVLASRQFVFSLPLFLVFFIFSNLFDILKRYRISPNFFLLPIIFIFIVLHPFFNDIFDYKEYKNIYDYLETLPKDSLIVGFPGKNFFTETVPFFSKRAIFFTDRMETNIIFAYGLEDSKKRREDLMRALYTDSLRDVGNFISKYNIDYFIIESYLYEYSFINHFKNLFSPVDPQISKIIEMTKQKNKFAILEFAKEYYDFKSNKNGYYIFIVDAKNFTKIK